MQTIRELDRENRKKLKAEQYAKEGACQKDWDELCASIHDDPERAVVAFLSRHDEIKPYMFRKSGKRNTRRAHESIRGRIRKGQTEPSGDALGRLREQAGEPLELRRVNLNELDKVAHLEYDICAQYDQSKVTASWNALAQHVDGGFWGVFERGRVSGRNHLQFFCKPRSCKLGVSNGIIPDDQLAKKAAYLWKPPEWESAVPDEPWYANILAASLYRMDNPGKELATRVSHRGLGNARSQMNPAVIQPSKENYKELLVFTERANLHRKAVKPSTLEPTFATPTTNPEPNLRRKEQIAVLGVSQTCAVRRSEAPKAENLHEAEPNPAGMGRIGELVRMGLVPVENGIPVIDAQNIHLLMEVTA